MRLIYILPLIFLTACSTFESPEAKYYAVKKAAVEVAKEVEAKVDECLAKSFDDPCRDNLKTINKAAKSMDSNLEEMNKIFLSHDSTYYNLSLSITENAVNDLKHLLEAL